MDIERLYAIEVDFTDILKKYNCSFVEWYIVRSILDSKIQTQRTIDSLKENGFDKVI